MKSLLAFLLLATTTYGQWYTDIDLMAMRIQSPVTGTNFDDYSFSPRIELGYEFNTYGVRTRYWHYDDEFKVAPPARLGFDWNVFDLEATKRIGDITLSGGLRFADESIEAPGYNVANIDVDGSSADTTQFGVTFAADGNTALVGGEGWGLSAVYGGRLSLLQGDWSWNSSQNTLLKTIGEYQGDTQQVIECNVGLEARYGCAFTRCGLEMQRWESNAIARRGWYDLGFLGIGATVGVCF